MWQTLQTKLEAYNNIQPHLNELQNKVYQTIKKATTGLTDNEISSLLEINSSTTRPRRIELERMGLICAAGTKNQSNGRKSTVWIANN